jgi:hypothetical protein
MTYFRETFLDLLDDKIFECFPNGYGGEKNCLMLVQDSLPIDTTIAKFYSLLITNFLSQLPLLLSLLNVDYA